MKKKIIGGVALTLVLGMLFVMFSGSSNKTQHQLLGGVDFISLYEKTPGALMLDVRTPGEFAAGHIQGATDIDFENSNFTTEIQTLDKTNSYFVYCRSGNRSGQAVAIMKKQGFQKIFELQGGITSNQDTLHLINTTTQSD